MTRLRTGEWCHSKPTGVTEKFTDKRFGPGLQNFAGEKKKKKKKKGSIFSFLDKE